jgi:hypothetical protein
VLIDTEFQVTFASFCVSNILTLYFNPNNITDTLYDYVLETFP